MKFMCLLLILLLILFLGWISLNFIVLLWTNYLTKRYFIKFDLKVREKLLKSVYQDSKKEQIEWYLTTDDPNRKIALIKNICEECLENDVYKNFKDETLPILSKYNYYAKKLKKLLDVFPTSFIGRLKELRYFNECVL